MRYTVWTREKMIAILTVDYPAMKREHLEKLTNTQLSKIATKKFNRTFIAT